MKDFDAVGEFHKKFGFPTAVDGVRAPTSIPEDVAMFRLGFLMEEMEELFKGYGLNLVWNISNRADTRQNLPEIADALVDLVYVALGTAHHHGFPWKKLFAEVQRANMQKVLVESAQESKRGHVMDVRKPVGWIPPQIIDTLLNAGWNGPELPFEDAQLPLEEIR